jgi:hypothetical protein
MQCICYFGFFALTAEVLEHFLRDKEEEEE